MTRSLAAAEVLPQMARALAEGTLADRAAVWLGQPDRPPLAATWPVQGDPGPPVSATRIAVVSHLRRPQGLWGCGAGPASR